MPVSALALTYISVKHCVPNMDTWHPESPWFLAEDYAMDEALDVAVVYLDSLKRVVESDSRSSQCLKSHVEEVGSVLNPDEFTLSCVFGLMTRKDGLTPPLNQTRFGLIWWGSTTIEPTYYIFTDISSINSLRVPTTILKQVQENANQDYDSKVLTPSREAIHESQRRPETQSRRSRGRPADCEGAGPEQQRRRSRPKQTRGEASASGGGGGTGSEQRRRTIAEATSVGGTGGRGVGGSRGRGALLMASARIEMWGQRRRIRGANSGAGGEDRAAQPTPPTPQPESSGAACERSRSTGLRDERRGRRVAVDVDDSDGRRRDGGGEACAAAGIFDGDEGFQFGFAGVSNIKGNLGTKLSLEYNVKVLESVTDHDHLSSTRLSQCNTTFPATGIVGCSRDRMMAEIKNALTSRRGDSWANERRICGRDWWARKLARTSLVSLDRIEADLNLVSIKPDSETSLSPNSLYGYSSAELNPE
ncbi:hypothetical protein Scep_003986 [Stephania cephalantha]|uniref:Uncharacterized protein n=1 Tax=Stephania cephalantha TaxID=152367 RepID=A0AAP0KTG1_9MAGN